MSSVASPESGQETLSIGEKFGMVFGERNECLCPLLFGEELGVFARQTEDRPADPTLLLSDVLSSTSVKNLTAPNAAVVLTRSLTVTARASERSNGIGAVVLDLLAVDPSELPVCIVRENRDVSRGDVASAGPPVMVFDVRLIHSAASEVASARLTKVGRRNWLVDSCPFSSALEALEEHLVGELLRRLELAPELSRSG